MTFLNGILLAGAAAFLIPLIIHLLNRRKVNVVRWGPMHLLAEVLKQKKRRLQLEQWLLLLLRIAIPIILALCLARPMMSALSALPGMGKTSMVVLLDDSFSMRAAGERGEAWERAKAAIAEVMSGLPRGSDVQVVLAGGNARPLLEERTTALDRIAPALDSAGAMAGPVKVDEAVKLAGSILAKSPNGARELVVMSDFQGADWRPFVEGAALPALDELKAQEPAPALSFFRLDNDVVENLAVSAVEMSASVAAESQPVGLRVRIKNHGKRLWQDVAVHLEADGARLRTTRVTVPGEGETTLSFTHAFDKVGDHSLGVRLEGDGVAEDNAWSGILKVRNQVNVLLVEGDPSPVPLEGAADFVELALAPHLAVAAGMKDLVVTTKVENRRLREQDFKGKEVVVLCDVERLNRVADLEAFVNNGGGLLVFAGPSADAKRYNTELWKRGAGVLASEIEGLAHADGGGSAARLRAQRFTHPALTYFNDPRGGRLDDAEFRTWWTLDTAGEGVQPLAMLDQGTPLLVERSIGRGKSMLFACTSNAEWSNLPLQLVWVPMVQRLVSHLATRGSETTAWTVGDAVQLRLEAGAGTEVFALVKPTGEVEEVTAQQVGGVTTVLSERTETPGVYELQAKETGAVLRKLAFNIDPSESDLAPLTSDQVSRLASRLGVESVESVTAYQKLDRSRRFGTELWQAALLLLLLFLFAEVLLQQRISRP
jgi:hypothetical protein